MTLSELARLANVSVSVASKAFSGKSGVSEAMRQHVFNVAKQNGCFHQFYNIPYDRRVVALIIPEAISKYYIKYVEAIKARLEKNNCTMLLSISNFDPDMERELIRYYCEHGKVDALISVNGKAEFPHSDSVIFAEICAKSQNADVVVTVENISGVDECLNTLREYGHEKIAFVGESLTRANQELIAKRMHAVGLEPEGQYFICSPCRFEEAGEYGVKKLMSLPTPPTAIIGAYGYISCGIISALEKQGVSIPEGMSVASFNIVPMPSGEQYELACVDHDIERICDVAVEQVCLRLDKSERMPQSRIEFSSIFRVGNTISKIRK